jgi:hypothetical protein
MMRKLATTLAVTGVLAGPLAAQEPVDRAMLARIRAEGLERSRAPEMFDHLVNVIGPRLTASPAYKQAADWAVAQLTSWGVGNPRLETFEFGRGWTLEKLTLEMTAPRYSPLLGYAQAWTPPTKGVIAGTPIYLGDHTAEQIEALGERLRGAIVLPVRPQTQFRAADRPQPADTEERVRIGAPPGSNSQGATSNQNLNALLQRFGAGVVVRPNHGHHGTVFVLGSRNTQDDAIPSVVLAAEHYNMIARAVQARAPVQLRVEVGVRYHTADTNGYNVIAEIPGTDPTVGTEVVLAGAHLDSWHSATGATDNADGVVAALEAVRILKAIGARPRRTIRIALWGGEEQGLLGSRAYVERHLAGDANRAARDKLYLYLNDDPGTGATYGFYLEQNAAIKPIFDAWLEPFKDLGAKKNVIDGIGNTDHLSFTRAGMPGFTAIKDYANYDVRTHHTNMDLFERVREEDLKQSAIVLASFLYHAAMREGRLPAAGATQN